MCQSRSILLVGHGGYVQRRKNMSLGAILRICECDRCIEKDLSLGELQLLAQQQDRHERRRKNRHNPCIQLV